MKNVIIVILLTFLIVSCHKSNESKLEGKWLLIDVSCECIPAQLNQTAHVWDFDVDKKKLTVTNNVEDTLQILNSGIYPIKIDNNNITIKTVTYEYYFKNGFMFLSDHPELDGPLLKFKK